MFHRFVRLVLPLLAAPALVAEVQQKAAQLVIVADSRRFTGWRAWWMNVYNDSHFVFAAVTVVVVPAFALILNAAASAAMSRIGINLKSRELGEH